MTTRKPRKPRDLYTRLGLTPPDWYAAVNRPDLRPLPLPCTHDWRGIDTGRICAKCGLTEAQD